MTTPPPSAPPRIPTDAFLALAMAVPSFRQAWTARNVDDMAELIRANVGPLALVLGFAAERFAYAAAARAAAGAGETRAALVRALSSLSGSDVRALLTLAGWDVATLGLAVAKERANSGERN